MPCDMAAAGPGPCLVLRGRVRVEGRQLTFLGVRSASSRRYDGEQGSALPLQFCYWLLVC